MRSYTSWIKKILLDVLDQFPFSNLFFYLIFLIFFSNFTEHTVLMNVRETPQFYCLKTPEKTYESASTYIYTTSKSKHTLWRWNAAALPRRVVTVILPRTVLCKGIRTNMRLIYTSAFRAAGTGIAACSICSNINNKELKMIITIVF